ncbi:MAG: hypothetical protein FJW34_24535 [Acidobacteria bacterium]|nr:hypothetical protein [Acidobacteriota bacterium]
MTDLQVVPTLATEPTPPDCDSRLRLSQAAQRGLRPRNNVQHRPTCAGSSLGNAIALDLAVTEWRPIPGFQSYEVSELGHVRRCVPYRGYPAGRLLKPKCNRSGYLAVTLYGNGVRRELLVHRLVAWAFIGASPSPHHEVAHGDGNKKNNHRRNLRWATKSENCLQKREHGTVPDIKGEKHPSAKLTNGLVLEMRRRREQGAFFREIAEELGIPKLTVYDAVTGRTWSHI